MVVELTITGEPPPGGVINVKGISVASEQVSTWVSPRSDDMPIGINRTPSNARRAMRERSAGATRPAYDHRP
jgi:hypothetical protein